MKLKTRLPASIQAEAASGFSGIKGIEASQ
jgi:hypothetical protein